MLLKRSYNAKIKIIENKISDITNLATNITLNAKINEVKNKTPSITNLATILNAKINEVKNKIPSITNLAITTALLDYNTKITDIKNKITTDHHHDKYIATQEFYKLT